MLIGVLIGPPPASTSPGKADYFVDQVGALRLLDARSTAEFRRSYGEGEPVADSDYCCGFRLVRYHASDRSEMLTLVFHPGSSKEDVSEMIVEKGQSPAAVRPSARQPPLDIAGGIRLGVGADVVERVLGSPHARHTEGDQRVWTYSCSSADIVCAAPLAERGMPEYKASYFFRDGVLVRFHVAFPYP